MNKTRTSLLLTGLGLGMAVVAFSGENSVAPPPAAAPVVTATMKDGKTIFQNVCAACHGPNGEGKADLKSPAIAGLPDWYAKHQLAGFREGRRGHDPKDAQSFMMAAISKSLAPEQVEAVIKHVSSLKPAIPAGAAEQVAEARLAEGMLLFQERCMECHRYNASGEIAFGSPPLIGQQGWYLKEQIHKFKSGQRGTIKGDVNGAKMVLSSSFIEDEQMLDDIVSYILSLNPRPEPDVKPDVKAASPFETTSR